MTRIGQAPSPLIAPRERLAFTVAGAVLVLFSAGFMWGFTVDDALISVRYARNLADGAGYRFDATYAATDGVTPLPWPFLLALVSRHADALDVLARSKALGLLFAVFAGARVAWALSGTSAPRWGKGLATLGLAVCLPFSAHAVSGMETSLVILLASCAATEARDGRRAAFAGLVAAFRPELLPWALALVALSASRTGERLVSRVAGLSALVVVPFLTCLIVRFVAFGHLVPLSVAAKPSDATHGLAYVGAAWVVSVGPLAALVPIEATRRLVREGSLAPAVVLAGLVHSLSVIFVGGDWMPYARLFAPIAPALLFAACAIESRRAWLGARLVVSVSLGTFAFFGAGLRGRSVMRDRSELVARARPELASAKVVAALDIGWVSAACSAKIVDLAGLTDPEIAALRGGHTSKNIAPRLLLDRETDVLLVYTTDTASAALSSGPGAVGQLAGVRGVEARLLSSEIVGRRFRLASVLPLGTKGAGYIVLRRIAEGSEITP